MDLSSIKFLRLHNERMTRAQYRLLISQFPTAEITHWIGTSEAGVAGVSTKRENGFPFVFRPASSMYIEIVESAGHHVAVGEEGDLLLTSKLPGSAFPVIRYRIGDRLRLVGWDDELPLFEYVERSTGERVRIQGGEIQVRAIEQALQALQERRIIDFVATVDSHQCGEVLRDTLSIELMVSEDVRIDPARLAELLQVNQTRSYADGITQGMYAPIRVAYAKVAYGEKKHRRLIDARV